MVAGGIRRSLVSAALLLLSAGCSKPKGIGAELDALRAAGHSLGDFKDSDAAPWQAKRCQSGTVDKLAAVLCEYPSPEALALGQAAADAWIGQALTGTALRRDLLLLAIADRDRTDLNGKAMAALARSFRQRAAGAAARKP